MTTQINVGPCDCCGEPTPCPGFCDATSVSFEFIGTTADTDTPRPCVTPCAINWSGTLNFVEPPPFQTGQHFEIYKTRWMSWSSNQFESTPGLTATGSPECTSASNYFGSQISVRFPCASNVGLQDTNGNWMSRNPFSWYFSVYEPDAGAGNWWGGRFIVHESYPGFPRNPCDEKDPLRGYNAQTRQWEDRPHEYEPLSFHQNGNVFAPNRLEDAFYQDSCEDFCGKTYTSYTDYSGGGTIYTTVMKFTFNCLP